jgi:hypothetical protein
LDEPNKYLKALFGSLGERDGRILEKKEGAIVDEIEDVGRRESLRLIFLFIIQNSSF